MTASYTSTLESDGCFLSYGMGGFKVLTCQTNTYKSIRKIMSSFNCQEN